MPPAARLSDFHFCPRFRGDTPHVGGPVFGPGAATVLIGGRPAARVGDRAICNAPPDRIVRARGRSSSAESRPRGWAIGPLTEGSSSAAIRAF